MSQWLHYGTVSSALICRPSQSKITKASNVTRQSVTAAMADRVLFSHHSRQLCNNHNSKPGNKQTSPKLVSWSLTSLFSTNMAISETSFSKEILTQVFTSQTPFLTDTTVNSICCQHYDHCTHTYTHRHMHTDTRTHTQTHRHTHTHTDTQSTLSLVSQSVTHRTVCNVLHTWLTRLVL